MKRGCLQPSCIGTVRQSSKLCAVELRGSAFFRALSCCARGCASCQNPRPSFGAWRILMESRTDWAEVCVTSLVYRKSRWTAVLVIHALFPHWISFALLVPETSCQFPKRCNSPSIAKHGLRNLALAFSSFLIFPSFRANFTIRSGLVGHISPLWCSVCSWSTQMFDKELGNC